MNSERLNKRDFAAAFDPKAVNGQFAEIGRFDATNVGGEARLAIGVMDGGELKRLAKLYGWKQAGSVAELIERLMKNWALLRLIESIGREALEGWTNARLDAPALDLGLSTIGNKENKIVRLLNWAAASRHNLRVNLAEHIQMLALTDAIRAKQPISLELVREWGVQTAIENWGYTLEGDTYVFAESRPVVFEVDGKPVARESLDRLVSEERRSLDGHNTAIGSWTSRLHETFQESHDGALTDDMEPAACRNRPGYEYCPRYAFSGRHVGTCFNALTDAQKRKHLSEARLRYLEARYATACQSQAPQLQPALI